MNQNTTFYRKVAYIAALAVLLFPLAQLGAPSTVDDEGGKLARLREANDLGQADLGAIDPASETIRLATLGLRGVAVSMLWSKANEYKKTEDWTAFQSTLEQLARLQPYFIAVWRFQGWNLTYNVSVESDDVRDRFYYVKQGIKYLQNGILYNRDNPTLLDDLGWFNGNKVGRADEVAIYRRLYKEDDELHPADRMPEARDNWLISKEWYDKAIRAIDFGGKPLGTKNPTTFFDSTARSQISYADAIETEGVFGPRAQEAWREGGRLWSEYGNREMPASNEMRIRLEDVDKMKAEVERLHRDLDALSPDLGRKLMEEALSKLTPQQQKALASTDPEPSPETVKLRDEASELTHITVEKIAARIAKNDPSKAAKAQQLASRIKENDERIRLTEINRDVANYAYWKVRCELEQAPEALRARELAHEAKKAFQEEADLPGAKELYEKSFEEWAKALDRYADIGLDSPTGSDIMEFVEDYAKLLEQMDLRLSDKDVIDKFALWPLVELNDPQRKFADDLDVWHGREPSNKARAAAAPRDRGESSLVDPSSAFTD